MNVYRRVTPLIVVLLLTVLFVGVVTAHPTIDTAAPFPLEGAALKYKGITYLGTSSSDYLPSDSHNASLDALKSTGANYASVYVAWYSDTHTSNTIYGDPTKTASDASIIDAINDIHARGMGVMLRPVVNTKDGNREFSPTNKAAWFASYATFIDHYARIAQDHGVELLNIGCEVNGIDTSNYANWSTIISGVRAIYSGPLTYGALWTRYKQVPFWNLLDYAGIQAYFPLSDAQTPSVADVVRGWSSYNYSGTVHDWLQEIETWQATIKKPVIFTEIGYRSCDYAAQTYTWNESYNGLGQANCYKATLKVFANKPWFAGMFWWAWSPDPKVPGYAGEFTPQNKPAQNVLTADWLPWYVLIPSAPA
jgi:hypothetical protein